VEAENREKQHASATQKKYPRHPIAMENTPEETIRRMQAFPERGEKLRELICAPLEGQRHVKMVLPRPGGEDADS